MCYDISLSAPAEMLQEELPGIVMDPQLELNFGTYSHVLAQSFRRYPVLLQEDGLIKLKAFEWGLIPAYMNSPEKVREGRTSMCNARSEKLEDPKSVWYRLRKQRCLIPVNGIYEHREVSGWKNKVPYFVRIKSRKIFFLPGLYNYSPLPDVETGEVTGTFTVITRGANSLMKLIHNSGSNKGRMPLFLTREMEARWLDPLLTDDQLHDILHFELPADSLESWPVFSIRGRSPRPDGLEPFEAFAYDNLPPLQEEGRQGQLF